MQKVSLILLGVIYLSSKAQLQSCSTSMNKITIICAELKNISYSIFGPYLACTADNLQIVSTIPDSTVSSIIGEDGSEIENTLQIEALSITYAPSVKFIPFGIVKKFPSLKVLDLRWSGLISVNKENLR